ncbi:MAG: Tad domain-containing protein, partial [Pseudolabrys sp.]
MAITFAIALIPLLAFIGAAIDYTRANAMKVDLQAALDSTALMVAKNAATMTESELESTARKYFLALFHDPAASNITFNVSYTTTGGSSVKVNGTADMSTDFIRIFGFDKITVGGSSTAKWGISQLRVALVLDNTGSMADAGKMTALKNATKNLLKQLKDSATTDGDVYVSIIPFSKDVSVGAGNYASWDSAIDWSQDWTNVVPSASTKNSVPVGNVGPGSSCPYSSRSDGYTCVTQPGGTTPTSTIPSSGPYKGYICPSNSYGCYDTVAQTTVVSSGWFASCWGHSNCSCSGFGYSRQCVETSYAHNWVVDKSKWNGCITDRGTAAPPGSTTPGYDQTVDPPDTSIPESLFPPEQYAYCPQAMRGLSYDWTAMNNMFDQMTPNGSTNQ